LLQQQAATGYKVSLLNRCMLRGAVQISHAPLPANEKHTKDSNGSQCFDHVARHAPLRIDFRYAGY
jgi:hypothetical protein